MSAVLEIDGSAGEGGGQLLRTAVALSALTGRRVRVDRIRAGRARPGLAAQHLTAVRAVAALCRAQVEGLAPGSQCIVFEPERIHAGTYRFEVGTAGSATLVLQALLPVMLSAPAEVHASITGGTDVRAAPPFDYLAQVLLPLLQRLGARVRLQCTRRGYYPRGGGEVACDVRPATLRPVVLLEPGRVQAIEAIAHVGNLPEHIASRMAAAACAALAGYPAPTPRLSTLGPGRAQGSGGALVLRAIAAHSVLGAATVAQRGITAERLGTQAGEALRADLDSGAAIDVHACDQLLVYLGLAGAGSAVAARDLSSHARTAIWLIEQFLPVRFDVDAQPSRVVLRVASR